MTKFAESSVVITGAGKGIGRRMAIGASAAGAAVSAWDIDEEALASLTQQDDTIHTAVVDVTDPDAIRRAAEALPFSGPAEILINNAGVVTGKSFLEESDEDLRSTMNVNMMAHFWTVRALLPGMEKADRGLIVTIASAAGLMGTAGLVGYSASKFAAYGFDEALRQELRQRNSPVKTLVVCPYFIDTGMFRGVRTRFPLLLPILKEEKVAARILKAIERDRRRLFMPWMVYTVAPLRILPVALFDAIADFFGVNRSMDHFEGGR